MEISAEMSAPATKADIEELKQLILSMKSTPRVVNNISYSGGTDSIGRTAYQASIQASKALATASR